MMKHRKERVTALLDDELYRRFDNFRFDNRFNSQSATAVALIKKGLDFYELERSQQVGRKGGADE